MSKHVVIGILAVSLAIGAGSGYGIARTKRRPAGIRESKFFKVNLDTHKVVGPSDRVAAALHLDLTSVTTDQPQYWPNEKVHLRILALGRPGAEWTGKLAKRDSQARDFKGSLDAQGVAVLEVLDGSAAPLELGEYRLDVSVAAGKSKGTATFAVVQGTLGALSFAHEFRKLPKAEELEQVPGGWYLGNASGAGARWGNGLSFKNELRVSNQPYTGYVDVNSRCMLPGCNGSHAGPTQRMAVEKGHISGTLDIRGHSGPFQIEVISPRGSLRHQFEGSSHVERDMVAISGGVSYQHRAGLAPYDKTVQVPGRDLFVESKKSTDDPFTVESVTPAPGAAAKLVVQINQSIKAPSLVAHQPRPDGTFESHPIAVPAELAPGRKLDVELKQPYTLVTIGGFVGPGHEDFKEGWALGLMPSGLKLELSAPAESRPLSTVPVTITARDLAGKGAAVSAILEVYDNRVPARSPANPLGSAIGDSVRNTSRSVSSWVDNTGIIEEDEVAAEEPRRNVHEKAKKEAAAPPAPPMAKPSPGAAMGIGSLGVMGHGMGGGGVGYGSGRGSMSMAMPMKIAGAVRVGGRSAAGGAASNDDDVREEIREGDRKVVFCQRITTDANGQAQVDVALPPQTGRLILRLAAVRALDYATTQRELDLKRSASVEARLPRSFVAGAKLTIPVDLTNQTGQPLNLVVDGIGVAAPIQHPVAAGHGVWELPLDLYKPGTLSLSLRDAAGKLFDQRELRLETLSDQPVTYSRLVFGDGGQLSIAKGESARVYAGSGPLMRGMVMNIVTTTESWFGHAEALSARAAVRSVVLAAISKRLLDDEGLAATLRTGIDKDIRDLNEAFLDQESGLIRPYPGVAPSPLWSAWTARNLLSATQALEKANSSDARIKQALVTGKALADRLRQALAQRGIKTEEQAGFDSQGQYVIPVEVNGQVVYRVLTDDAVTRWASEKLLPRLDLDAQDAEVAFSKVYDVFRFLRAFERVGNLQYLTDLATAYYLKGDHATFARLYRQVARGMILSQEPGLIQGPALLGGVYSTPMAMVRFLELQLLLGSHAKPVGAAEQAGAPVKFEQTVNGPTALTVPAGAIVRVDRKDLVQLVPTAAAFGRASVSKSAAQVGEELTLEVELDPSRDPLEYYAIVAVPTTTSVKQTEDILSDYRGQLIYGQQGQGGTQMQLLTVPFRGKRSMRLLLEGAYRGSSPGLVVIRHIESRGLVSGVPIPAVTVR